MLFRPFRKAVWLTCVPRSPVADLRASTPGAAAESLTADRSEVLARLKRDLSVNNCLRDIPGCGQFPRVHCPWPRGHALRWFFLCRRDAVAD